jgi:hypothetical protein
VDRGASSRISGSSSVYQRLFVPVCFFQNAAFAPPCIIFAAKFWPGAALHPFRAAPALLAGSALHPSRPTQRLGWRSASPIPEPPQRFWVALRFKSLLGLGFSPRGTKRLALRAAHLRYLGRSSSRRGCSGLAWFSFGASARRGAAAGRASLCGRSAAAGRASLCGRSAAGRSAFGRFGSRRSFPRALFSPARFSAARFPAFGGVTLRSAGPPRTSRLSAFRAATTPRPLNSPGLAVAAMAGLP